MLLREGFSETEGFDNKNIKSWISASIMFAIPWGLGGLLDEDSRVKFDAFLKKLVSGGIIAHPIPANAEKLHSCPDENTCYSYCLEMKGRGIWKPWSEMFESNVTNQLASTKKLEDFLVPTSETAKFNYFLDICIANQEPLIITGLTGTGKSAYILNKLSHDLSLDKYLPIILNFTARTSANQLQNFLLAKLQRLKRTLYGPPPGKKAIFFIDDLNMPALEIYGAQPPVELLRQYQDLRHWYDLKDATRIDLKDIQLIGAMGPPGGGRNPLNLRFTRHFLNIAVNPFNEETMIRIFSTLMTAYFRKNSYPVEYYGLSNQLITATMNVYENAKLNLLPTPAKSHYVFNLRDFSRVVNGMCMIRREQVESTRVFMRLWIHEVLRIFSDRLIADEDFNWIFELIKDIVKNVFSESIDSLLSHIIDKKENRSEIVKEDLSSLMFNFFLVESSEDENFLYAEMKEMDTLYLIAEEAIEEYNTFNKNRLNLVMFKYALEHLSRIGRILKMEKNNALLVGLGGSGKQSLTKLAVFLSDMTLFRPNITSRYGVAEWKDDLKLLFKQSGSMGKKMVFLVTDSQLKEESFVEDIDSILNSGDVPNLFTIEEKGELMESVRKLAQKSVGGDLEPLALYSYFIRRCKENLTIVLTVSPIGSSFRNRLRQYPSLINCCTINWFHSWPDNALEKVATTFIEGVSIPKKDMPVCVSLCKYFHLSIEDLSINFYEKEGRHVYITPNSYIQLLDLYKQLISKKQNELTNLRKRYVVGLEKLNFAASQVSIMQEELAKLKPELQNAADENNKLMSTIENEQKEVEKKGEKVKVEEEIANKQAEVATKLKTECEADLSHALPALESALAALDTLKPSDIALVKSMKNPPAGVKLVMQAICVMKSVPPDRIPDPNNPGKRIIDYWGPSKRIIGEQNFLKDLKEYDKDNISPAIIARIQQEFLPNPEFVPAKVIKASSAAEGLCKWIIAMEKYDRVAKVVAPKKARLAQAQSELAKTQKQLNEKRSELQELNDRLAKLKQDLVVSVEKKGVLQTQFDLCVVKLERAEKLIGGLGGEKQRWAKSADDLTKQLGNIVGDMLISSAAIVYLGPFVLKYRKQIQTAWATKLKESELPASGGEFSVSDILGNLVEIQAWNIAGLPRDNFSIDNGVMLLTSLRWPLMIDPQNQANKWVKNMEKDNQLSLVKPHTQNIGRTIELCLSFGKPLLLEGVGEELDPSWDPILLKTIFFQAGIPMVQLGDKTIEYNENFRLYITTNLVNPHYLPEIFIKVNLINFMITPLGLEDQLLGLVVAKERPELEEERQALIVMSAKNKKKLKEIEDTILQTLSVTEGNILEDEEANIVLESSKATSDDIIRKQQVAENTEAKINEARKGYTPIAKYSSLLFFALSDISKIDPMYQYSLVWFINLYLSSIQESMKSKILDRRLRNLSNHFTYNLFSNVCRSLFEHHKLVFSLYLTIQIEMSKGELNRDEFSFFLSGGLTLENTRHKPDELSFISEKCWNDICSLNDSFEPFANLIEILSRNFEEFDKYLKAKNVLIYPEVLNNNDFNDFQKMMILKLLRPDKIRTVITNYVSEKMGKNFVEPPSFDLDKSYADSNCSIPLIFILSPGADPTMALLQFATKKGFTGEKMQSISLGQGQGPEAMKLIFEAKSNGTWVLLQNCHFAVSWMPTLEKICEELPSQSVHENFRLWLTSYPSNKFPVSILQNGVKMTNEPPTGLKQNLLQSFLNDPVSDESFYDGVEDRVLFHKMVFSLCFFHALVQERKKFGAIGWNISYGFNDSDLSVSLNQLQLFMKEATIETVPFTTIIYVTGECNYGGRVTDNWDRRCLMTTLKDFCNPRILTEPKYTFSPSGFYYLPSLKDEEDYNICIEFIKELPPVQMPEVFGLHDNVDISKDLLETKNLFNDLLTSFGSGMGSTGKQSDESLLKIADDILYKMPADFDIETAFKKYPVVYEESMNTVLIQEMERFNNLTKTIKSTINQLIRAIKGLEVMSGSMEVFGASLLVGRIPETWQKQSYPSLKPLGSYINDLLQRIIFFKKWYDESNPTLFWISGFYFTQAFLTGLLQNYARKNKIAIDLLGFDFQVLNEEPQKKPSDGAIVYGLFLDGASWSEEGNLNEQPPYILYSPLPNTWFIPKLKTNITEEKKYNCPVYKTSERKGVLSTTGHSTNFVLSVLLLSKEQSDHWIKRGLALLCQLDD